MRIIREIDNGNVLVQERSDYTWGVVDKNGNEIVPFGKYNWIDRFDSGLARVKIEKKELSYRIPGCTAWAITDERWGIINDKGEEVLPVEYSSIWNFYGKNRYSTKAIKDGKTFEIYFCDLNPALPVPSRLERVDANHEDSFEREEHYEEFAGTYAQDYAGYSDEDIYDAFDGDPEAYWNID